MKKLVCIFLAIMVLFTIAFSGCDKITKNTDPNSIKSSIVTEKEWREACSFIGMRDRGYELINEIEYPVMKKISVFISNVITYEEEEQNYDMELQFTSIRKDNTAWACKVNITTYINGQKIEEKSGSKEISESNHLPRNTRTHAYYMLGNSDFVGMNNVVDEFNEYSYEQESGAYCRTFFDEIREEQKEIKLKFKGNRIVCYQEFSADSNTYILFYNYK